MRKTFMPVDISNLKDLNMKRRRAIEQLLDTERQYVKAMRIVVKFKTYLESRKNVLSRSEFNTMFSCVDQLLELHVEHVLKALEEQTTDTINVGTLFADLMAEQRKSGMRALYTQYSTNLPEALLLVYAKKHGGVMKAYLDKFENELNLDGKRSLNSFLVIPVDYPVKLLRHLKAIDQATPSSSNDKADLETAIISLRSLVARIEDAQEDIDRATAQSFGAKLVEASTSKASSAVAPRAQNGTAQPLHVLTNMALLKTPWRSFICKGSVWEVINPTLVKERTLFLFNDCLLIAKEEGNIDGAADASSSSLPAPKNTIRTVIDLNAMELRLERDSDPMDKISESLRVRKAVHMFESNPRDAIAYLVRRAVLTSSPKAVAEFLLRCGQLNKRQLGKFLGALENREVLVAYLAFFSFAGQRLDVALRLMLVSFRLPGDAKTIDSVLDAFASAYYEANPGTLSSPELVLRLAYTLLMLNTEIQRSRSGTNKPTMNSRDFAKRFKAHDQRGELSDETLGQMYEAIAHDNFVLAGSGDGKGMSISISNIPVRAEIRAFSATVTVSIPKSDDNLRISLVTSTGIKCVPSELTFAESPSATFRIAGAALGKSRIFFVATGRSAGDYSTSDLPQGKPIIVEPAFMSVCFQLRSKMRDEAGRKLAYMFSVANEIQRDNWSQQIQNVLDGLQNGKRVTYGLPLADSSGGEVVDGFVALNGGALIVPSGSKLEMVEAEDTSLM